MKKIRTVTKRLFMALIIFVMIFSINPQPLTQENVSTVEAATIKLNYKKIQLRVGQKKKLILKNADGEITWKSNKKKIVKVNKNGKITAKKKRQGYYYGYFQRQKIQMQSNNSS